MNKKLIAIFGLVAALFATPVWAAGGTRAQHLEVLGALDQSATAGPAVQLGTKLIKGQVQSLKAQYSFAVVGGAIGTVTLRGEDGKVVKIPKGAVIVGCTIDVLTAPTSGGAATIALGTGASTTDLKVATAIASYTGLVACATMPLKMSADQTMSATIASFALTAGKINVVLQYILSDT